MNEQDRIQGTYLIYEIGPDGETIPIRVVGPKPRAVEDERT